MSTQTDERAHTPKTSREPADVRAVTPRAVLLALALLAILTPATFYVEIVWHAQVGGGSFPAVAVIVFLAALGGLPGFRRAGLSRRELLTVYAVLAVGSPLVGRAILFFVLPKAIIYYHMGRAQPTWESGFLQYMPLWFCPSDPDAVEGFFLGQARVPWSLWLTPLFAWLSFVASLFLTTFFMASLVQRQWVRNERLSFPLAQVPLETVREPGRGQVGGAGRLSLAPMLWVGVGLSFALNMMSRLSTFLPGLPTIPLGPVTLIARQNVGPLAGLGELDLAFWPWLIGIVYIIPKELSFSCWFFWLVRLGLHVLAIALGATPMDPQEWYHAGFPAPYHQGTGALFALGIWVLWIARRHLDRAVRIAFSRESGRLDDDEPVTYRWALIGLVLSFGATVLFGWLAGCRITFTIAMMLVFVVYFMMSARLRVETALDPSVLDMYQVLVLPGTAALRPREIIALVTMRWATFPAPGETLVVCTSTALENMKIADAAAIRQRGLARAVIAGFLVALVLGGCVTLWGIYRYGYFGTGAGAARYWPSLQSRHDGGLIMELLTNPAPVDSHGLVGMAAGGIVAIVLGMLRLRMWWWPLHPVGYIIANSWGMHWYLVPFLIGWSSKTLVLRYGGLRLYRQTFPLAIGLIVGDMLNRAVWSAIMVATGGHILAAGGA